LEFFGVKAARKMMVKLTLDVGVSKCRPLRKCEMNELFETFIFIFSLFSIFKENFPRTPQNINVTQLILSGFYVQFF